MICSRLCEQNFRVAEFAQEMVRIGDAVSVQMVSDGGGGGGQRVGRLSGATGCQCLRCLHLREQCLLEGLLLGGRRERWLRQHTSTTRRANERVRMR